MSHKHNSVRRIVHRCFEELKATMDVAKVISFKAAFVTFRAKIDIQIMNRNGFKEPESVRRRLLGKHKVMLDFLEYKFREFWISYSWPDAVPDCDEKFRDKIWICWWQGLENAPEIVKACVESIRRNAGGYDVVCITELIVINLLSSQIGLKRNVGKAFFRELIIPIFCVWRFLQNMAEYGLTQLFSVRGLAS